MRKILALLFSLCACAAQAQIVGTLPFTLQNGTIADANQVMSDLNTIVAGVNANAATAGINTNINALNALTTPLVYTSGGTSNYIGGTSGGSANAQILASPIPTGFTLTTGKSVTFAAGFTNSGPMTLNVASTGATNVFKQTASGAVAMSGGEIFAGQVYTAVFDGTQYQIQGASPQGSVLPCTSIDWVGAAAPSGYLLLNGQLVSRTTFATLFNCIAVQGVAATTTSGNASVVVPNSALFQIGWSVSGNNVTCNSTVATIPDGTHITISINAGASGATTLTIGPYSQGDCSTTFAVGDFRGRTVAMRDVAGSTLTAATCTNPASIGSNCGAQTQTLTLAQLPTGLTSAGNNTAIAPNSQNFVTAATTQTIGVTTGATNFVIPASASVIANSSGATINPTSVTSNNTSGTAHPILPPVGLVDKYIKF